MIRPVWFSRTAVVALLVCAFAAPAWAQFPAAQRPSRVNEQPTRAGEQTPQTGEEPSRTGERLQQPQKAPLTLVPAITITEEYDDNVLFNNRNRQWDLVTTLSPSLTLTLEEPTWRINAAYDFGARLYAREPNRNNGFDRQNFLLDTLYRISRTAEIGFSDTFSYSTGINAFSPEGVVTGRDTSWSNTMRPTGSVDLDRQTTLHGGVSWSLARYERTELRDSTVWRADATIAHVLTRRLRGTLGYDFGFFDIDTTSDTITHTPRLGVIYDLTPTMKAIVSGGPTFEVRADGQDRITPAASASLTERRLWGSVGVSYNRAVGTAGGLGGTTDNQLIAANVALTTLGKGMTLEFAPQYRTFKSSDLSIGLIDVKAFAFPIQFTWQFTPWIAMTAGYSFFYQRSDSTVLNTAGTAIANDVDQNRVFVGFQVGYPIRRD